MFRDSVRERDLDNFLVEELHASPEFLQWLLGKLEHALDPPVGAAAILRGGDLDRDAARMDRRQCASGRSLWRGAGAVRAV
jgi:hypothetical protein